MPHRMPSSKTVHFPNDRTKAILELSGSGLGSGSHRQVTVAAGYVVAHESHHASCAELESLLEVSVRPGLKS